MTAVTRDANGRFAQGNAGGPGRPKREVEAAYLAKLESVVDDEAWSAICEKATVDAIAGDPKARQWLTSYLLGMPVSRVEAAEESGLAKILRTLDAGKESEEA